MLKRFIVNFFSIVSCSAIKVTVVAVVAVPILLVTNREKLQNSQQSTVVHCLQFQVKKQITDPPIIQIPDPYTSRTCSAILVPTFKAIH